jgi:RND family efflux transporter MFP subunit
LGALINAGESTNAELFRVADINKLRIYAQVPQAFAGVTKAGLKAELHFTERPGQPYTAKTMRTSRALDPTSRTLQVELQLDNKDGDLFPGAYTEIHFKLPSPNKTLRVPANTVLFRADGLQVATVDGSHKIKMKNIIQGRDFGKTIEILDGIDEQDNIVVNPSDSIEDGLAVRIAPPPNQSKKSDSNSGDSKNGSAQQNETQSKESSL